MEARGRIGRPTTAAKEGEKATLGIRASAKLKGRLQDAAEVSGRSLSAEAEFRLEQSFRGDGYLDQAMDLAYGPRLAVLLAVIGRAMNEIGRHAPFPTNWMDQPHLFEEAASAAGEVIDAFRPDGRGVPHPILVPGIVRPLLAAIRDPKTAGELKGWAVPLHAKLENTAARLRIQEGPAEHLKTQGWEGNQ